MSPDEFDALLNAPAPGAAVSAPQPQAAAAPQEVAQPGVEGPGRVSRTLSDIGTGITEIPRAVVGGVRDAIQETGETITDSVNYAAGTDYQLPKLPAIDKPKSVTGGFAHSVSQFVTGLVGLGKITKPLEVVTGVVKAGKLAKAGTSAAKAATVGAVAFDPHDARLSDLVESVPGLSNPVSRFLRSSVDDSAAMGRVKNAIESLGMDATLFAAIRLFKALKGGNPAEIAAATKEAEKAELKAAAAENPKDVQPDVGTTSPDASPVVPDAPPAAGGEHVQAPDGGVPGGEAGPTGKPRDVLDIASPNPERDVLAVGSGIEVKQVDSVTQGAGPDGVTPKARLTAIDDAQLHTLLDNTRKDIDAFTASGGWEKAIENGHSFGRGERVQWQKLAGADIASGPTQLEAFVARVADTIEAQTNKARGGNADGVMRDAQVERMVGQRAALYGEDPAALFGIIAQAGKSARTVVANFEASMLVGQRLTQDTYALAVRFTAGDFSFAGGDKEAASYAIRDQLRMVATINGNTEAMKASFGRGLRRSRAEFAVSQSDIDSLMKLDPDQLAGSIVAAGANPKALKLLATPSTWTRLQDASQFMLVNNLLWGWRTHAVNFATNMYMVGGRPLERYLGSIVVAGKEGQRIRAESLKQYAYMASSLYDSFQAAKNTWLSGDSVLAPHKVEFSQQGISAAGMQFKSPDNIPNILYNALLVPAVKMIGVPTRALGTVDELMKQTVYRSMVQSRAHVAGVELKLQGDDLTAYVQKALMDSFDDAGRGIDVRARQEAMTATFSQDLLTGTMGKSVQSMTANHPAMKMILPFVRTPTNVMRMGIKLTPGLNLLQAEYRQMASGAMGVEAQAQAIGQMSMGSLFLGTAAMLAHSGSVTGGGPSDPKLKAALMATGWQPYSFVTANADGSRRYTNFGRFDPIAVPLGMVADLVDVLGNVDENHPMYHRVGEAALGILLGITKQLAQKTYLKSLSGTLDAIVDPDRKGEKVVGQLAANYVPFSSNLRQFNSDPYLRDARTIVDSIMATIPGLSATLPAKRNMWGDPLTVNKGLWVDGDKGLVDAEVRRMVEEGGVALGPPNPTIDGVDLRDITLKNGKNAYDHYQTLAAQPAPGGRRLKDVVAGIMKSSGYKNAPDGEAGTKGTRLAMLTGPVSSYRDAALRQIKADPVVRKALSEKTDEVRKHYSAQNASKPPEPQRNLEAIGAAFGIDLSGASGRSP